MIIKYNSRLARLIIPSFKMILICFVLLCKKDPSYYTPEEIEHERCHCKQWFALFLIGILICFLISTFYSYWVLLLSPLTFYIWYGTEFLIRLIKSIFTNIKKIGFIQVCATISEISHDCYRNLAFEKEARAVEQNQAECHYISFLHYY